jgi:hypothetical protein
MPKPVANPLPIQYTSMTKEQFASDSGVAFHNLQLSQIVTTLNAILGSGGPTLLPSGIDVRGAAVTGLATPTSPSDAISAGHADTNYSAAAQQPQLDIGGKHALKGLTGLWLKVQQLPPSPSKYGGLTNYFNILGLLLQWGTAAGLADNTPTTVTFPIPFPNACFGVVANDNSTFATAGNPRTMGTTVLSLTQCTIEASGLGASAFWVAVGW